ncbi:LacI family DNA-binding transcriptional regulator [Paraurantiacibacter namhicola]|uniref:Putative HTH-type transcriptional repressor ExuR n=1 Tax=Paraurantiacibacter namhicola TaxID=645517 RepID=A0A1C7D779_9SPHN|nr:LacI family DNA-binding transcriptional regulator [Paraurantiacibacter namhicola]ANU07336.1 putative HTH-type transcriptional repressor ExuR [Paraurantiacibacter namhicola]
MNGPNGTNGRGSPTINDVARIAEVSKKTVSRVINKSPLLSEKTRKHVEGVIREIGYVPNLQARALALRRNFIVAAIHDNPNAQFLVKVQQGILSAIKDSEFGLMVQPVDRHSPTIVDDIRAFLERQRPYGVVLLPPISENDDIARLCEEHGCRFVRMGSVKLDSDDRAVASNDREAVRKAVTYLIDRGHTRIGLIEGPQGFTSPRERRAGFEEAMAAAGLSVDEELVSSGTYTFESGVSAGQQLIDLPNPPTAIFASNDEMAIGAMIAARRHGLLIPEDLSIIGFDDTPLSSHVWPALTTVHWPIVDMAHLAASKLVAPAGEEPDPRWLLPSELIERASVVAPKS